jgi:NADPH:quinone reductase-like Zn-dependent oxidoreductase
MRAVVHDKHGPPDLRRLKEVERPEPTDDELAISGRDSR